MRGTKASGMSLDAHQNGLAGEAYQGWCEQFSTFSLESLCLGSTGRADLPLPPADSCHCAVRHDDRPVRRVRAAVVTGREAKPMTVPSQTTGIFRDHHRFTKEYSQS